MSLILERKMTKQIDPWELIEFNTYNRWARAKDEINRMAVMAKYMIWYREEFSTKFLLEPLVSMSQFRFLRDHKADLTSNYINIPKGNNDE
jgi:hypothetical protein